LLKELCPEAYVSTVMGDSFDLLLFLPKKKRGRDQKSCKDKSRKSAQLGELRVGLNCRYDVVSNITFSLLLLMNPCAARCQSKIT